MLSRSFYNESDVRKRQIDTLKIFNDNVTEVTENNEYTVDFSVDGKKFTLNVVLGIEFPNEKPLLFLKPGVPHPWVDESSNEVIGAPGLLNYSPHSDLGRIVQAVIREFQKSIPNNAFRDMNIMSNNFPLEVNSLFPVLNDMSIEQLQDIFENTDLQDEFLENNQHLAKLELETLELMDRIERIANENIENQKQLNNLKNEVMDRVSKVMERKLVCEDLSRKHQKLCEMYDPHRIRDCLKEASIRADEEAERIAEQFLKGELAVETFVARFAEKRALGQTRRAREERLAHQLAQLDRTKF